MLGRLLGAIGKRLAPDRAVDPARAATRWVEQGIAHNNAGELADAAICFERALALDPASIPALHGRATMHHLAGDHADAISLCDEVLAQAPGHAQAWITRAVAARALGNLDDALQAFRRAVELQPQAELISCVGGILFQQGHIEEALIHMDRAIAMDPLADAIHSNRLFILNHDPRLSPTQIAQQHFAWGRVLEARLAAARTPHGNDPDPDRRLKIGYVSADLRTHSVAFFLAPVLERHDRSRFEVTCYDNHAGPGDDFTKRLMSMSGHWVKVAGLDDAALARRIREDRIDILVDLSGHTGGNRLPVFAMKPAPVAATWFGYMNTTGLTSIDYRLSDACLCPPGCEARYSESIYRLPHAAAWSAAADAPEPGPPPSLARGHVRFASFNNWTKVSDAVIDVWARILTRVPSAELLVVAAGGDTPGGRAAVRAKFVARAIDPQRIVVEGFQPLTRFLAMVGSADIALDPFPYNGGTTTLHTLWMAVPVISMASSHEIGRVAEGLLGLVGLADLCTRSPEQYVEAAVALADDAARRTFLRSYLRPQMQVCQAMNGGELASNLEKAYRALWHNWTDGKYSRTSQLEG